MPSNIIDTKPDYFYELRLFSLTLFIHHWPFHAHTNNTDNSFVELLNNVDKYPITSIIPTRPTDDDVFQLAQQSNYIVPVTWPAKSTKFFKDILCN